MALPNASPTPATWDDAQLAEQAKLSLDAFVDRRLAEPRTKYIEHLRWRRRSVEQLFRILRSFDPAAPNVEMARRILLDDELQAALRYVVGPPISDDDLGVLVTRAPRRLSKADIKANPKLATDVLRLVCRLADSSRFPWLAQARPPRRHELKQAIRATATLHAAAAMQTERRRHGREVEAALRLRLVAEGLEKLAAPSAGKIHAPKDYPKSRTFYGECSVYGRKTDLLVGLEDGRVVAVEAKDSASVINSVKRVLNDTAAKAKHWNAKAGEQIIPVALLSGVFGVENLKSAQASGLFLVWSHDMDSFIAWLLAHS
jgi:hypothetical protein